MDFTIINNPSGVHPTTGYSHAVKMGGLIFVSGQVAKNEQDEIIGIGDPEAQAKQVFKNLKTVLESAGSGLELIGKMTVLITDLSYRPAVGAARDQAFASIGHVPASTLAVISSLAHPDLLVEIEAIAALRE